MSAPIASFDPTSRRWWCKDHGYVVKPKLLPAGVGRTYIACPTCESEVERLYTASEIRERLGLDEG